MEKLFSLLTQKFRTKNFAEASNVFTDPIIGASLLTITSFINERKDCALIAPNQYAAQRIYEFLLSFLKEEERACVLSDEPAYLCDYQPCYRGARVGRGDQSQCGTADAGSGRGSV